MTKSFLAKSILNKLEKEYPQAKIALRFKNNWELLVSVILSSQCTDKKVNEVTKKLFRKYKNLDDYVAADLKDFERDIKSTGYFRAKAKNILADAKIIREKFNGKIPKAMEEILTLKGVARKTANVVLGNAYGVVEGIAVDTHVNRLAGRLGLSRTTDPNKIEQDLMKIIPREKWFKITYLLIAHGRKICQAKNPLCNQCILSKICPSAFIFRKD